MQNINIHTVLAKLMLKTPNKLIENSSFYTEELSTNASGIRTFCSDQLNGEIKYPPSQGSGNVIVRGHRSLAINSTISFTGNNNIVFLGPHSRLSNADIRVTGNNCILYFGAFSSVESMLVMLTGEDGKIEIGDHCMFSARIIIDRSDHHPIFDIATGLKVNEDKDVVISDHVWIGRDVRVSKGCHIGTDAIIGQASLAIGQISGGCAYGGVPARCIREGVTWSRVDYNSLTELEQSEHHKNMLKSIAAITARR